MSLDRALHGLPGDRATEALVREVLEHMIAHVGECFSAADVACRVGKSEAQVSVILSRLAEGFVLRGEEGRFRYLSDPVVDLDVKRFLHRSDVHMRLAQDNLARFRDRFGHG